MKQYEEQYGIHMARLCFGDNGETTFIGGEGWSYQRVVVSLVRWLGLSVL